MDPITEGLKKELQITELDAPLGSIFFLTKTDIVGEFVSELSGYSSP